MEFYSAYNLCEFLFKYFDFIIMKHMLK